jgi:hypothetical protein
MKAIKPPAKPRILARLGAKLFSLSTVFLLLVVILTTFIWYRPIVICYGAPTKAKCTLLSFL